MRDGTRVEAKTKSDVRGILIKRKSMMRNIECLTWEVTFYNGEESRPVTFSINVDRDYYDDPKDAAIDHLTDKWDAIKEHVGEGFLPKFKTFRILNIRKLSDLAWNRMA